VGDGIEARVLMRGNLVLEPDRLQVEDHAPHRAREGVRRLVLVGPVHHQAGVAPDVQSPHASSKHIALIAHDNRMLYMLDWARFNSDPLAGHELDASGTTGGLIEDQLGHPVTRFLSGPLDADLLVAAGIAEGRMDGLLLLGSARTTGAPR
jgi:hypothetical protein